MSKRIEMNGLRFGRLLVTGGSVSDSKGKATWNCLCDCGTVIAVGGRSLRTGNTTSCGCKRIEKLKTGDANRKHGKTRTPEYRTWQSMHTRCYNRNSDDYPNYGGCGITICDRWKDSFETFLADMGLRPSPKHSIDRFPNPHGNYEPSNCRWATMKEQHNNRRDNYLIAHEGETKTITEWANQYGLSPQLVRYRIGHGWTIVEALIKPSRLVKAGAS